MNKLTDKDLVYDVNYYMHRKTGIDPYLEFIIMHNLLSCGRNKLILDVGCGSGVYVDFLRSKGFKVFGIDFSRVATKISGEIAGSALYLPFKNDSFDLVLSVHMVEHLNPRDAGIFFTEARRVLKNNGVFFVMTPNIFSPGRLILRDKWFPDKSHINLFNPLRLAKEIRHAGFKNIRSVFFLPFWRIKRTPAKIVQYYGLDKIFKKLPILQDLLFFLMFSTPLAFFRDVIYLKAKIKK